MGYGHQRHAAARTILRARATGDPHIIEDAEEAVGEYLGDDLDEYIAEHYPDGLPGGAPASSASESPNAREQMLTRLDDIATRRRDAFSAGNGAGLNAREHLALIPEATTPDDIDTLHEAREMLDDFSQKVLDLYVEVWREWGAHRCSVCAMTPKQAKAIGYDCAREC